jgi:hypothetical protein
LQIKPPTGDMYTIAMGDLNFIEQPEDHTPTSPPLHLDRQTERV